MHHRGLLGPPENILVRMMVVIRCMIQSFQGLAVLILRAKIAFVMRFMTSHDAVVRDPGKPAGVMLEGK